MDIRSQTIAITAVHQPCTYQGWTKDMIESGWDRKPILPADWKEIDDKRQVIVPKIVLTVDLPWLPLHSPYTCYALIAASLVETLATRLDSAPPDGQARLSALTDGLYILAGSDDPRNNARAYTTALRTVIPLWHKVFVPCVVEVKAVFAVVVGIPDHSKERALLLYDTPFQLPWGFVAYRKVTYETDPELTPRTAKAEPWSIRSRMV